MQKDASNGVPDFLPLQTVININPEVGFSFLFGKKVIYLKDIMTTEKTIEMIIKWKLTLHQ